VWDYPRPAICEPTGRRIEVAFGGVLIASTRRAMRVLETSHPPTYYIPREDILADALAPAAGGGSLCEWKGLARYFDVRAGGRVATRAAWAYDAPTPPFRIMAGHVAFYGAMMDACRVDGEQVRYQDGGFYGGWITPDVVGPFKGGPGTMGW
jgi:uncharacterized protein (DUF427 family)